MGIIIYEKICKWPTWGTLETFPFSSVHVCHCPHLVCSLYQWKSPNMRGCKGGVFTWLLSISEWWRKCGALISSAQFKAVLWLISELQEKTASTKGQHFDSHGSVAEETRTLSYNAWHVFSSLLLCCIFKFIKFPSLNKSEQISTMVKVM